jgi:hypothetical protein
MVDRQWPHQVAVPEAVTVGSAYPAVLAFCEDLSLAPRGHAFYRDGESWQVWCFASKTDAEKFQARFGGEFMDPADRPPWPGSGRRRKRIV